MTLLIHDIRAMGLSARTITALHKAGLRTWDELVTEAQRTPNLIRSIDGLGPKGVNEVLAVLTAAHCDHTIRTRRPRTTAASSPKEKS